MFLSSSQSNELVCFCDSEMHTKVVVPILLNSYLVIGLGRQVHFSTRMRMVMKNMTLPEARKTLNIESVLDKENTGCFVMLETKYLFPPYIGPFHYITVDSG